MKISKLSWTKRKLRKLEENKNERKLIAKELDTNMLAGMIKLKNIKGAKLLASLRNVNVSEIKYRENRKLIPVEVNLKERLRIAKFKAFYKSK